MEKSNPCPAVLFISTFYSSKAGIVPAILVLNKWKMFIFMGIDIF